jgi:hypothetical protein
MASRSPAAPVETGAVQPEFELGDVVIDACGLVLSTATHKPNDGQETPDKMFPAWTGVVALQDSEGAALAELASVRPANSSNVSVTVNRPRRLVGVVVLSTIVVLLTSPLVTRHARDRSGAPHSRCVTEPSDIVARASQWAVACVGRAGTPRRAVRRRAYHRRGAGGLRPARQRP